MRYHPTLVKKAAINKTNNKCQRGWQRVGWGKKEPPYTAGGNEVVILDPVVRGSLPEKVPFEPAGHTRVSHACS